MGNTHVNTKLERYIDNLLNAEKFATRGKIAEAIGMTDSGFSRAVRDEGTLSIECCVLLAKTLGEKPSEILRVAGREAFANMLDGLYRGVEPEAMRMRLSRSEREMFKSWRTLTTEQRHAIESMIHVFAKRMTSVRRVRGTGTSPSSGRSSGRVNRKGRFGG